MLNPKGEFINCKNISKQFGYFFALKNISLAIRKNTIFGIAGSNGAGKTTLVKILSGILKPTMGRIIIEGMNYEEHSNILKQNIGITTDESFLYSELTIFENLKFYDNLHFNFKKKQTKIKIEEYAKKFDLIDWIDEPIRNLSHGMKQKVELIRSIIHHPSILFLDEPFSGLDYKATDKLINFLLYLKRESKISIILTTHKIEVFQQICDDLVILKKGKLVKSITKEDITGTEIEAYF
jgi:ABC-type multidrug transport system ATPase subunit